MADLIITGASGFLGAYLMRLAMARGLEAVGVVRCHPLPVPGRSVTLDLTDADAVRALVAAEKPRAVVHAAALTSPDACEMQPRAATALNVSATQTLAHACRAAGTHLTFISTDLVFDGERGQYAETDALHPINHYARTKAQAETAVLNENDTFAVVRPSFIYGEPLAEHHASFSHRLYQDLRSGVATPVFHDQYRSPILVNALAAATLEISTERLDGVWHVAGTERASRADFARALAHVAGLDPSPLLETSMDDVALPAPRPRDVSLNVTKARHRLQNTLPSLTDGFHFLYGKGG